MSLTIHQQDVFVIIFVFFPDQNMYKANLQSVCAPLTIHQKTGREFVLSHFSASFAAADHLYQAPPFLPPGALSYSYLSAALWNGWIRSWNEDDLLFARFCFFLPLLLSYLIFVNFGTKKRLNSRQNSQHWSKWAKIDQHFALSMLKSTPSCGCDKYQL